MARGHGSFKGKPKATPNRTTSVTTITIPGDVLEAAKKHGIVVSHVATEAVRKEIQVKEAMALNKTEEEALVARLKKERSEVLETATDMGQRDARAWFPHARYDVLKWFEGTNTKFENGDRSVEDLQWVDLIEKYQRDLIEGGEDIDEDLREGYWQAFADTALDLWSKVRHKVEE